MPLETTRLAEPPRASLHPLLRQRIRELAQLIVETCPVSEDREEALSHLDAVAFFAVGSMRHELLTRV